MDSAEKYRMVVILGLFYFGQDQRLCDEISVKRAIINTIDWLMHHGYHNILIEIANECDHPGYVLDGEYVHPEYLHPVMST